MGTGSRLAGRLSAFNYGPFPGAGVVIEIRAPGSAIFGNTPPSVVVDSGGSASSVIGFVTCAENGFTPGLGWLLWLIIILGIALVLFFILGAFGFFKRKKPPTDSEIEAAKAEADMEMDGIDSDEILDGGDDGGGGGEVAEL